jgi:hypothetical protein
VAHIDEGTKKRPAAEQGLTRLHATTFDERIATIRKPPGLSWDYIAERVAKQGGELHLLEIRWEMPLPARHACFFSKL